MAKVILYESHDEVLKSFSYNKKRRLDHGKTSYEHSDGHSVTVYHDGSWAHFDPKGFHKGSVSNKDNGTLLKDYLSTYHKAKQNG